MREVTLFLLPKSVVKQSDTMVTAEVYIHG